MQKKIWILNHYASEMFFLKNGRHYNFAGCLKSREYEPVVFCCNACHNTPMETYFQDTSLWHEHMAQEISVPFVFVYGRPYMGNGKQRVMNMFEFYRNVKKAGAIYAQKHGKPDVILASSVHPLTMVAGIQLAKKLGVPCICEIRDLWPEAIFTFGKAKADSLLGKLLTSGEHWIYKKADALIFTKEGDTDYLKEHRWTTETGGDIDLKNCYYINNGVNLADFDLKQQTETLDDQELLDDKKFNVVYAGTIRPVNNVGNLLSSAAILQEKYPDIQFLIYGSGDDLPALRQRVKDENLKNVKLKGLVEGRFIPFILSHSSCNVLNYSQNEFNWSRGNSSNKLFEYMASGKPIISTVQMGYSIINRYHCGMELKQCTPQCLAEAIVWLHDMPKEEYKALGENARKGAGDFDFEALTDRLEAVIESVLPR